MQDILFHLNLIWISLEGAGLIFMLVYKYLKYRLLKEEMMKLDDKVSMEEEYTYNINKMGIVVAAMSVAFMLINLVSKCYYGVMCNVGIGLLSSNLLWRNNSVKHDMEYYCKKIPMEQLLDKDIRYCITEEHKRRFKMNTINIEKPNGFHLWVYPNGSDIYVKDLIDKTKCATKILSTGYFVDSEEAKEIEINKSTLLEFASEKNIDSQLKEENWKIDIPCRTILIRNDYAPDCYFKITTQVDSDKILQLISRIQPELVNEIILGRRSIRDINEEITEEMFWSDCTVIHGENLGVNESDWKILLKGNKKMEKDVVIPETLWRCVPTSITQSSRRKYDFSDYTNDENIYNAETSSMIKDIDEKLKNGFQFRNASVEAWEDYYKKDLFLMLNNAYKLSKEQEEKILNIVNVFKEDLYDANEERISQERDITISAMESMMKMNGIGKSDFESASLGNEKNSM